MDGVRAWELLNTPEYCGRLDMEGLRKLMLRAGYSVEVAHQVAKQRGWERICAGEKM